ncbi:MAG: LysR family transcriptional regulator, partial [Synergistaceae bacterium]|nr:LysR family transcriptional regulator [Synergistaceae bacterium]
MELRLLKYFLEAANERSITRAAKRLHIPQPSLSKQLGILEHEVGRKLYVRENYGIRLTNDGLLFRKRVQEIIDLEEKTLAELAGT